MKFKTHEQIDHHYRKQGLDVDQLNREFQAVGNILRESEKDAVRFLKNKMGRIKFFFWDTVFTLGIGRDMSAGFGQNGYVEKAKEYGFNHHVKDQIRKVMKQ